MSTVQYFNQIIPKHWRKGTKQYMHSIQFQFIDNQFCSVLFFSSPRSEGWPHHGRTFSIYPCPLSFWLTLHGESRPRLDVVHPGRAWSSSPACTWHCSLRYLRRHRARELDKRTKPSHHLSLFDDVVLDTAQSHQRRLATVFLVDSVEPLTPLHFALCIPQQTCISVIGQKGRNVRWPRRGTAGYKPNSINVRWSISCR